MVKIGTAGHAILQRVRSYNRAWTFRRFEAGIHPETWRRHDELLSWAELQAKQSETQPAEQACEDSDDPVVRQGYQLARRVFQHFKDHFQERKDLRILVHLPPANISSAGFSLFSNLIHSFRFLGLAACDIGWFDNTREVLQRFKPTIFLTSDHYDYLSRIEWDAVKEFRASQSLKLGLTASLPEYGNTSLDERFDWAQQYQVDFYYTFRAAPYVKERYRPFIDRGYKIFEIEFGANPLRYYAVPGIRRDLNYVFLASSNPDKWPRYFSYCWPLFAEYAGYIDGPWWSRISRFGGPETHRFVCARAKVALNLHIQDQIDWACELNERTYNLAACGVPQLIDKPKLLADRFRPDSFFIASAPSEYMSLFNEILNDPAEAGRRALQAQREVFDRHTIFHRATGFINSLSESGLI
jgi:hypothetical protein